MNDRPSVIKDSLLSSIKNKENTTKENIDRADKINFNPVFTKIIITDQYGFIKPSPTPPPLTQRDIAELNEKVEKWTQMLNDYTTYSTKKYQKLKARARKGVPDSLRGLAWKKFASISKYYKPNLYSSLLNNKNDINDEVEAVILKDLDRTFPLNFHFTEKYGEGQRSLYHVLSAYAKYNKNTEYVQGMGFIAALLLTYMDEESAFYTMHSIMKKYEMEGLYLPGFPDLKKHFYVLLCLMKKHIPKVYHILYQNDIVPTLYASEWFITLFTREVEFDTLVRIFDVFFVEGFKVIYRFSLAFLKLKQYDIIHSESELSDLMNEVKRVYDGITVDELFEEAFKFSISRNYIRQCEDEYERVKGDKNNEFVYMI